MKYFIFKLKNYSLFINFISICSMLLQVNSKPLLPNHLVEEDFINAAFVRNNRHAKLVFDDQRFHKVSKYGFKNKFKYVN